MNATDIVLEGYPEDILIQVDHHRTGPVDLTIFLEGDDPVRIIGMAKEDAHRLAHALLDAPPRSRGACDAACEAVR